MTSKIESNENVEIKDSFLLISEKSKGKVFEIKSDGSVWTIIKGKFQCANTSKKLGIALGEAFKTLAKLNEETIKQQTSKK